MAEKGAHLTPVTHNKPSIFDCIAQETLNDLLHPLFEKVINVLSLRNEFFSIISKWCNEMYFLGYFGVQFYFLKKYGATFSEKFYGLKRESLKTPNKSFLGTKEQFFSLLTVVLFPYLKLKLNNISEKFLLDDHLRNQNQRIDYKKIVTQSNTLLNIFCKGTKLYQCIKYLSGKSDIYSPQLWAAGVKLKYAAEMQPIRNNFTPKHFIQETFQSSLGIIAFFIQFLQWWEIEKGNSIGVVPIPPPPEKSANGIKFGNKCPICQKPRTVDTVLSTSGYVFCFQCISSHLLKHNYCPVTKLPATVDNLIHIYSPS